MCMFKEFLRKLETHEEPKLSRCEGTMIAALCCLKTTNDTVVFNVAIKPLYIYLKCLYVNIKVSGPNNTALTFCSTAQWSIAILRCWPLRHFPGHGVNTTSTQHLLGTLWGSIITLKGLWELFIQWLVPAIKFDWLTYIPALMFIPLASGPLHSPSKKVGYSGAGWGGMDGLGDIQGMRRYSMYSLLI